MGSDCGAQQPEGKKSGGQWPGDGESWKAAEDRLTPGNSSTAGMEQKEVGRDGSRPSWELLPVIQRQEDEELSLNSTGDKIEKRTDNRT